MTSDDLDQHTRQVIGSLAAAPKRAPQAPVRPGSRLDGITCLRLYRAQLLSRHLDFAARWMQQQGRGYYTIASAGHEGNAAVALATRVSDPALLHYRSGAFYCARAMAAGDLAPDVDPVLDVLLGVAAAADEPIAGGRHKVFGRAELNVIPQTSTIASHLPRALGLAVGLGHAAKLHAPARWPRDAVVVCSFGDATVNHSTALGAINAACHTTYRGIPVPLLFVCEDNGLGISVPSPPGWIEAAFRGRSGLEYVAADGCDPVAAYDATVTATGIARARRVPVFLHLSVVRLLGHAGADVESTYRTPSEIARDRARDPVVTTARVLVDAGVLTPDDALALYVEAGERVHAAAEKVVDARPLADAEEVMRPLAPRSADRISELVHGAGANNAGESSAGDRVTLAQAINRSLEELLCQYPGMCVFGEDVGVKGGVYGVTKGLQRRFGPARVFDTLLDEQSILGMALGTSLAGLLPVPEIQYLAYLHNAEDQLRGEAATMQFFSQSQYRNGMVVRVAGLGYQKGFGGHFHNDNSLAVLRDIPGLIVGVPTFPDDAAAMLRTCAAAAVVDGAVAVLVEPIALYHEKDLYADGDGRWLAAYPSADTQVALGRGRTHGAGTDLTILTFGNGVRLSLRAAATLESRSITTRVLDLRWIAPLPVEDLLRESRETGRVLVVDETRQSGGVAEGVLAALIDGGYTGAMARVTAKDSFIPLGPAARTVLVSEQDVVAAAESLVASTQPLSAGPVDRGVAGR